MYWRWNLGLICILYCYYLRQGVCLSDCQQAFAETAEPSSVKFCGGPGIDPKKNPLNFGVDLDESAAPGIIFFTFFSVARLAVSLGGGMCSEHPSRYLSYLLLSFNHPSADITRMIEPRVLWWSGMGLCYSTQICSIIIIISSLRLWQFVCWTNYKYDLITVTALTKLHLWDSLC